MGNGVVKVPQIMQMEALECGAASLAMILAYHGRWEPLEKVRAACGISRDGSNAWNIVEAAQGYGLEAWGSTYSTEALRDNGTFPCIAFWNFNHFVVVDGFKGNYAYLNDPARGEIKMPVDEFDQSFTGVALEFKKTDAFEEGGEKPSPLRFVHKRLKGLGGPIAFVMVTAAVTSLVAILNTSLGKVFMDHVLTGKDPNWLMPLITLMIALALVTGVVSILNAVYLTRIQGKIAIVSSSRFMRHLLHLPVEFYSQRMVGDLQQRLTMNESIAFSLIGQLAPVLINSVMLVLYLGIMLNYSLVLTAVGLATILINAFLARYISNKRVNISRAGTANAGKLYATTVSGVDMIETIKSAGAENGFFKRWAGFQAAVNESDVQTARLDTYLGMVPGLVTQVANIVVLALGVLLIVKGEFTPGALLAFTGFLSAFMAPVNQMINLGQTIQEMTTQMERVEDVLNYPVDVSEDSGVTAAEGESPEDERWADREKLHGQIDLEGVTFGYSPFAPPLISGLDLHLKPGQWVALVGSSGCGKSTVAKLISGLYQPWEGTVKFDGVPIAEIPRSIVRGSLAVVDQDIVTFDDSVSDNVKLWDRSVEDYEVILACRDAGVHDVVAAREDGYLSPILPGGSNFSGGQLQRLEIARALASDPTMIILDEATSALDARTEADVIRRIRKREITCIVVAHRLSTIRDCDEIIVLDHGEVVERGTHDELMAQGGAYTELVLND